MNSTHKIAPDQNEKKWPSGIPFIIGNEACERFSYYGMKAILYVYITSLYMNLLRFPEEQARNSATGAVHLFIAGVYALPMIGAIISDRLLGKYLTIISLSMVYCLGHACLAIFESSAWQLSLFGTVYIDPLQGLYLGLFLIVLGSGGIKPCVSAHVGDQFGKGNWHLLQKVYNVFYFAINFGSVFGTFFIPVLLGSEINSNGMRTFSGNTALAFGIPGILMGLATIFFWMGRKHFIHVPPSQPVNLGLLDSIAGSSLFMVIGFPIFFREMMGVDMIVISSVVSLAIFILTFSFRQKLKQDDGFLAIIFHCIANRSTSFATKESGIKGFSEKFFAPARSRFGNEVAEGPVAVLKIMSVFIFISVFWALFDQHASTWIEQAKAMNRDLDLSLIDWMITCGITGILVGIAAVLTLTESKHRRLIGVVFSGVIGAVIGAVLSGVYGSEASLYPSQIPSLNPIMVMILIPYTVYGIYPLAAKFGVEPKPLLRITWGMFIGGLAFAAVAIIQMMIDSGNQIHVVWQIIPYGLMTLSEVMVSITGLEFAYSQAPKRMKSVIMGFWLFNITLGNLIVVFLAGFQGLSLSLFFWVFAVLMFVAAVLFWLVSRLYVYRDYTQ